jgi:hypothetical protein
MAKSEFSQCLVVKQIVRLHEGEDLLSRLCALMQPWDFPVTVIAGHYFLLYDAKESRLVGVLSSAVGEASLHQAEKDLIGKVGDFPMLSLITGLRLLKAFPDRSWRIAVAVDDHQFQRVQCDAPEGVHAGELRKSYYQQQSKLPREFEEAIFAEGFKVDDVIIDNSSRHRDRDSVLPRKTLLFSEVTHRNRFTDKRRKWLLKRPGFSDATTFFEEGLLYFRPLGTAERLCLIGSDGRAYCSGAMVEFLFDLTSHGSEAVLMFIPGDCRDDVDLAVEAFMSLQVGVREIIAVWQTDVGAAGEAIFGMITHYTIA